MSRIGRQPVQIPAGVEVKVGADNLVTVKGPKGELSKAVKERAANTDQQITNAGEQIRTQIPDWMKYDMSQHKTREGGFIPGSINRYPVEKHGGKI